jgi:phage terminase large subunit-like protein
LNKPNLKLFAHLKDALAHNWRLQARPSQLPPPGDWIGWLVLAGRGWGKTWTGASYINEMAATGQAKRIALIGATAADTRDVMVEGPAGILAASPVHARPTYEPSKRKLTWKNGAIAHLYSSEEADRLRGPQHDLIWADELAAWNDPKATWDQAMFGLRIGRRPRWIVTTTPRPLALLKSLVAREGAGDVIVTRGSTYENARNLAPGFLDEIRSRYEGTRLARQEIEAQILEDVAGALWSRDVLEKARYQGPLPDMRRVVVAIDPSGTSGDDNGDSVGIVVAGIGSDNLAYVLADRTCKLSPDGWGRVAVNAYREFKADRIVAERNFGGAMVQHVIRSVDDSVSYRDVTASRGKIARAEPVAALYEQGKVRHCGALTDLEDQLTAMTSAGYLGDGSPDRADALVWALSELMLNAQTPVACFGTYSASARPFAVQHRSKFDGVVTIDGNTGFATSR